jgi:flagellar protein FlgJ
MTAPVADSSFYADFTRLDGLARDARAQDPQALREAAKQFESIFTKMMISSMRKASFGDPLLGSDQQDFYQGMFDDQIAVELSRGKGLGLADMLVQQLTRKGLATPEAAAAPAAKPPTLPSAVPAIPAQTAAEQVDLTPLQAMAAEIAKAVNDGPVITAGAELPTAQAGAQKLFWRPQSRQEFIRELWPCAEQAGRELGIDPRHLLAQAALETGWGQSLPCNPDGSTSFNLFGIKAGTSWEGQSVAVKTLEFEGGIPVARRERFRAYESAADSFRDYVAVLRDNPRYAAALNTGSDAKAFAGALQRGGYATDPAYARKIATIAQNLDAPPPGLKSGAARPMTPGEGPRSPFNEPTVF